MSCIKKWRYCLSLFIREQDLCTSLGKEILMDWLSCHTMSGIKCILRDLGKRQISDQLLIIMAWWQQSKYQHTIFLTAFVGTALSSYAWHPRHENRLLALSVNGAIKDTVIFERIPLVSYTIKLSFK